MLIAGFLALLVVGVVGFLFVRSGSKLTKAERAAVKTALKQSGASLLVVSNNSGISPYDAAKNPATWESSGLPPGSLKKGARGVVVYSMNSSAAAEQYIVNLHVGDVIVCGVANNARAAAVVQGGPVGSSAWSTQPLSGLNEWPSEFLCKSPPATKDGSPLAVTVIYGSL